MKNFRDQLKVEGVNARGYGILPKMVMLDRKLTIESKAIYSYFCSYAGAGNQAFPGTSKIQKDLCIGKDRYYKHFNLLKDLGYIKVEQVRNNKGLFKHNLYTLVTNPEPKKEEKTPVDKSGKNNTEITKKPSPQNQDTDKDELNTGFRPSLQNQDTDNPNTDNRDTNINTLYKSNNSLYNHSFSLSKKEKERMNERKIKKIKDKEKLEEIFNQADINKECLKDKYNPVKRSIETLFFRSKPLIINNISISVDQIRKDLKELNSFHIEMGLRIFDEQSANQVIRNKISYLAVCIYNAIFDMDLKIQNDLRYDGII